ncbi:XRE family transcriptional regulator [Ornithinicoccus hortensis]|uniref:XRE family transcriptional regulator n=2 Tax=Ornithinicoccus hortensis TaxID=82346 RepID=A0A542YT19_9MICO|nr:XRE family transcriptional regulator [Ornithinicoccus hortensis]
MHMSSQPSPVLGHLASNVRRLRQESGLSQLALAERAGISRRTVIALEAGEANIGLASLDHVADALGTNFTDLVKAPSTPQTEIDEILWRGQSADSSATLLGSAPASTEAQLWVWRLAPGDRYDAEPDPGGWHEIVLVTAGRVRIERRDGTVDLTAGQRAIYPSDQPYSYVAPGDQPAEFARIVTS